MTKQKQRCNHWNNIRTLKSINQPLEQSIKRMISAYQSINQSINQSMDKSMHQSNHTKLKNESIEGSWKNIDICTFDVRLYLWMRARRRWRHRTAAIHMVMWRRHIHGVLHRVHPTQLLLDEPVNKGSRCTIGVADVDSGFGEELLQFRVGVVVVEALFRVPADMLLVPEMHQSTRFNRRTNFIKQTSENSLEITKMEHWQNEKYWSINQSINQLTRLWTWHKGFAPRRIIHSDLANQIFCQS